MDRSNARRTPRVTTHLPATLIHSDGVSLPVTVVDLSSGGFRLRCGERFEPGEKVALRVPRYGDFPAEIEWASSNEAGGRFLAPVRLEDDIPT